MSKPHMGARVRYCGHAGTFVADIFLVAGANVVRHDGPVTMDTLQRPAVDVTHRISDMPSAGFWRPDLGVFVVPEDQVVSLVEETFMDVVPGWRNEPIWGEAGPWDSLPLEALSRYCTPRAWNAIVHWGELNPDLTVGDLRTVRVGWFLKYRGTGSVTLGQVRAALKEFIETEESKQDGETDS